MTPPASGEDREPSQPIDIGPNVAGDDVPPQEPGFSGTPTQRHGRSVRGGFECPQSLGHAVGLYGLRD